MSLAMPSPGRGPGVMLPLAYLATAALAFLAAAVAVPWLAPALAGHYYHPHLLALAHTVALGWITLAIMGATYQLLPVVLERPVWSERLGRWLLGALVTGVTGMVAHFWIGRWPGLLWAAGLVGLGAGLHGVNVALSLRAGPGGAPLRGRSFTAGGFAVSLVGLGATAALGLTLAANRVVGLLALDPFAALAAHFHLALLLWVAPMVVAVAARSYPTFLLAPAPADWLGPVQLVGLGIGAPVLAAGLLAGSASATRAGAFAVAAALGAHAAGVVGMVRGRKRPGLDWGLRFVLTGTAYLGPAAALGLALATGALRGPRPALAYGVLALGGWVSLTIAGMMLKIVPFLVWYQVYAGQVGREPVPALSHLGWPAMERVAYLGLAGAPLALAAAIGNGSVPAIRLAGLLLAAGALAFAASLAAVLRRLAPAHLSPGAAASAGAPA